MLMEYLWIFLPWSFLEGGSLKESESSLIIIMLMMIVVMLMNTDKQMMKERWKCICLLLSFCITDSILFYEIFKFLMLATCSVFVISILLLQVFGVPSVVAHVGEKPALFFGSDRFPVLAQEINETWMGPEPGVSARL